ncbi:MAG: hypothetical protein RL169_1559 [Armatimonadota bacterium]|jgi:hypothetical protein
MIANSRPLYFVPHTGATMPWQDHQCDVSDTAHRGSHVRRVAEMPGKSPECVLASMAYASEIRTISPLALSGIRAPGLILMANRYDNKELRMSTQVFLSQPSEQVQPSFAQNVFLLLMLG